MARQKKEKKKVSVSFCTTKEVLEGVDAIAPVLSNMQGRELSRSEVIEIALLSLFKAFNKHVEEYLTKQQKEENKENKEEK